VILEILAIIAPVFICAALGVVWARSGQAFENEFITRLVMWVGAPCLIVGTLGKVDVSLALLADIALAVIVLLLLTAALAIMLCRMQGLPWRNYLPSLVFPNTGNMGLPLALFAFGEQGLTGVLRGVLIIQSTMPVAVFNYLLAIRYRKSPEEVAGAVMVSTLLSFATLPALLWFVLP